MKKLGKAIGSSIGIAGALAFSALNTHAQNLLVDGDFENASGITPSYGPLGVNQGWAVYASPGTPVPSQSDMNTSPEYPESGKYALLELTTLQSPPNADFSSSGAQQIVSGINPGSTYKFNVWFLTDTGADLVNGGIISPVVLEFDFLNSSEAYIGSVETTSGNSNGHPPGTVITGYGATNTGFSYTIPNDNVWYRGSISGTAPAGAVYAVVYAEFLDFEQVTTEDVYFDNASLTLVPEPSSLTLITIELTIPFFICLRRKVPSI